MALNTYKIWSKGIKIAFYLKKSQKIAQFKGQVITTTTTVQIGSYKLYQRCCYKSFGQNSSSHTCFVISASCFVDNFISSERLVASKFSNCRKLF